MYEPFEVEVYDHYITGNTRRVLAKPHDSGTKAGTVIEVELSEECVFITKEQAMKFFGLVEPDEHGYRGFTNPIKETPMITLNITQEQAEALREVCTRIGGSPNHGGRKLIDDIAQMLEEKGIHSTYGLEDKYPTEGSIRFK